jgi:hypothetical protein
MMMPQRWLRGCGIGPLLVVAGCGWTSASGSGAPRGAAHTLVSESGARTGATGLEAAGPVEERPGLGTSWGEAVESSVSFAPFARAAAAPDAEVALHYNDAEGVQAQARSLGAPLAPLEIFTDDRALSVAVVDEFGRGLPGFTANGRTLIMGEDGARYRIVVRNGTPARFEVVASVDGLDVIDGKPADPNRRGYVVNPYQVLSIDGFRTSDDTVAAFRFGGVGDSYAARTSSDRDVGVIGLAVFAERGARWSRSELDRRDTADPFPARGYAAPPR